jgi:hypothetical protein
LERGESSELTQEETPQTHGPKSAVRGLRQAFIDAEQGFPTGHKKGTLKWNRKGALALVALMSLAVTCNSTETTVKNLDKAKLKWQWRSQRKGDQASEFRVKCGTASGRYNLPIVRVPFPNLEVPIKQIVTKPGRYFCVITAANHSGESSPSNEVSFNIDAKGEY